MVRLLWQVKGAGFSLVWKDAIPWCHSFFASCSNSLDGLHGCHKSIEIAHCTGLCTFLRGRVQKAYSSRIYTAQECNHSKDMNWEFDIEFHQKSLLQDSALPLYPLSVINPTSLTSFTPTTKEFQQEIPPFLRHHPPPKNIVLGARALIGSDGHHVRHAGWPATQLRATCELITLNQEAIIHLDTLDASEVVFRLQLAKLHIKKKYVQDIPECESANGELTSTKEKNAKIMITSW